MKALVVDGFKIPVGSNVSSCSTSREIADFVESDTGARVLFTNGESISLKNTYLADQRGRYETTRPNDVGMKVGQYLHQRGWNGNFEIVEELDKVSLEKEKAFLAHKEREQELRQNLIQEHEKQLEIKRMEEMENAKQEVATLEEATFVKGIKLSAAADEQLIRLIETLNADKDRLTGVNEIAVSSYIENKIKEIDAAIDAIAEELDNRG